MKTSVIIPTMGRPDKQQVARNVSLCLETVKSEDLEVVVVVERNLWVIDTLKGLRVKCAWRPQTKGPIVGWNEGSTYATGDVLVLGADDLAFREGWYDEMLKAIERLPECCGVVGLNDTHRSDKDFATHFAITRSYCMDFLGGVFVPPVYLNFFVDVEIWARSCKEHRYIFAEKAIAEHQHFFYDHSRYDSIYQLGQKNYETDSRTFDDRLKLWFPNTWEPILKSEVVK